MSSSQEHPASSEEEHTSLPVESETSPAVTAEGNPSPTATKDAAETAQPLETQEPQAEDHPAATADSSTKSQSVDTNIPQDATRVEPAATEDVSKAKQEEKEQPNTVAEKEEPSVTTTTTTTTTETPDPRANWMPDDSATACSECGSEFTFMRRRHHCRVCGRLFCGDCTQQTFELPPQYGWKGPQRVCESCYLILYSRKQLGVSPVPK